MPKSSLRVADRGTALGVGRVMPRIPAPQKLKPTRLTNESKGCLLAFGGTRFACALYLVFGSHRGASVLAARAPCGISLATFHSHHLAEIIPHTAFAQDVFGLEPSKRQNGIRLLSAVRLMNGGRQQWRLAGRTCPLSNCLLARQFAFWPARLRDISLWLDTRVTYDMPIRRGRT